MNSRVPELNDSRLCYKKTDKELNRRFKNKEKVAHFFSPARVNLIGEHIDYCGGLVLPCAIDLGIQFSVAQNSLNRFRVFSFNTGEEISIALNKPILAKANGHWAEYVKGVVQSYQHELPLAGLDIVIDSNVPGGGLSSSAALEVGLSFILEEFFLPNAGDDDLQRRKNIAWRAQKVENDFVGVNCGIMDQAAVALGKKSHAIKMDCRTLSIAYIAAQLEPYQLVICNTNKDRKLADSKYNERRAEVEAALIEIQKRFDVKTLCDVTEADKCKVIKSIDDPILASRARHVIEENIRVHQASESLTFGSLKEFGRLLNASHQSLKSLYEVSCAELDFIAEQGCRLPGVAGARMTGAGFGGCAVMLVRHDELNNVINYLSRNYYDRFGFAADFYPVSIETGTQLIKENDSCD
jgi:galactokinase